VPRARLESLVRPYKILFPYFLGIESPRLGQPRTSAVRFICLTVIGKRGCPEAAGQGKYKALSFLLGQRNPFPRSLLLGALGQGHQETPPPPPRRLSPPGGARNHSMVWAWELWPLANATSVTVRLSSPVPARIGVDATREEGARSLSPWTHGVACHVRIRFTCAGVNASFARSLGPCSRPLFYDPLFDHGFSLR